METNGLINLIISVLALIISLTALCISRKDHAETKKTKNLDIIYIVKSMIDSIQKNTYVTNQIEIEVAKSTFNDVERPEIEKLLDSTMDSKPFSKELKLKINEYLRFASENFEAKFMYALYKECGDEDRRMIWAPKVDKTVNNVTNSYTEISKQLEQLNKQNSRILEMENFVKKNSKKNN